MSSTIGTIRYNKSILTLLIVFIVLFLCLFAFQWYSMCQNLKEYKIDKEHQLDQLQKSKTNLIDLNKLEKSKKLIIIKSSDLVQINDNINKLAEEIYSEKNKAVTLVDKDIDRLNLYMAIGISFISIIGIFVPVITNFLSHDDLKQRINNLETKIDEVEPKINKINVEDLDKAISNADKALEKSDLIEELKQRTDEIIPKVSTISLQITLNRVMNMTSTAIKNIRTNKNYSLFIELFSHLKEELNKCKNDNSHSINQSKELKETLGDFTQMFNDEKIRFVSIIDKKELDLEFTNLIIGLNNLINSATAEQENEFYSNVCSTIDKILEIIKK